MVRDRNESEEVSLCFSIHKVVGQVVYLSFPESFSNLSTHFYLLYSEIDFIGSNNVKLPISFPVKL